MSPCCKATINIGTQIPNQLIWIHLDPGDQPSHHQPLPPSLPAARPPIQQVSKFPFNFVINLKSFFSQILCNLSPFPCNPLCPCQAPDHLQPDPHHQQHRPRRRHQQLRIQLLAHPRYTEPSGHYQTWHYILSTLLSLSRYLPPVYALLHPGVCKHNWGPLSFPLPLHPLQVLQQPRPLDLSRRPLGLCSGGNIFVQLSSLTSSVQDLPTVLSPGQEDVESSRWQEETKVTVLQTDDTMDPTMEEAEEGSEPEANSEVIGDETPQAESTTVEGEASVPLNSEQNDSAEADQNHTNSVKKPSKSKLKKVTLQRTTAALHNRMRRSFAIIIIIIIISNIIIDVDVILLLLKVLLHACCRRRQRRGWQRSLGWRLWLTIKASVRPGVEGNKEKIFKIFMLVITRRARVRSGRDSSQPSTHWQDTFSRRFRWTICLFWGFFKNSILF